MANRTRPIRIEICVTEQERQLIRHKMAQLGTKTWGHMQGRCSLTVTSSRWITPNRKNWLLLSVGLLLISIRYVAVSTRLVTSIPRMWPN